jgi:hypothetical protein
MQAMLAAGIIIIIPKETETKEFTRRSEAAKTSRIEEKIIEDRRED